MSYFRDSYALDRFDEWSSMLQFDAESKQYAPASHENYVLDPYGEDEHDCGDSRFGNACVDMDVRPQYHCEPNYDLTDRDESIEDYEED